MYSRASRTSLQRNRPENTAFKSGHIMAAHSTSSPILLIVWQRFCEPARLRIAYCPYVCVLSATSH